jgi:hypothetical protein
MRSDFRGADGEDWYTPFALEHAFGRPPNKL